MNSKSSKCSEDWYTLQGYGIECPAKNCDSVPGVRKTKLKVYRDLHPDKKFVDEAMVLDSIVKELESDARAEEGGKGVRISAERKRELQVKRDDLLKRKAEVNKAFDDFNSAYGNVVDGSCIDKLGISCCPPPKEGKQDAEKAREGPRPKKDSEADLVPEDVRKRFVSSSTAFAEARRVYDSSRIAMENSRSRLEAAKGYLRAAEYRLDQANTLYRLRMKQEEDRKVNAERYVEKLKRAAKAWIKWGAGFITSIEPQETPEEIYARDIRNLEEDIAIKTTQKRGAELAVHAAEKSLMAAERSLRATKDDLETKNKSMLAWKKAVDSFKRGDKAAGMKYAREAADIDAEVNKSQQSSAFFRAKAAGQAANEKKKSEAAGNQGGRPGFTLGPLCKISSPCQMADCMVDLYGLSSNSASPTDTWIINFRNSGRGTIFEASGNRVSTAFVKVSILSESWISSLTSAQKNSPAVLSGFQSLKGLEYEMRFYKEITNPLIDGNICPHFIRSYSSVLGCSYADLLRVVQTDKKPSPEDRLKRNISYMYNMAGGRPSITNSTPIALPPIPFSNLRYCFLANESVSNKAVSLYEKMPYLGMTDMMQLLFQVAQACYSLYLTRSAHNDLHLGNIWVQQFDSPKNLRYIIDGKTYDLEGCKYEIKLYDFDLAYSEQLGSNLSLARPGFEFIRNKVVSGKDFVKVVCGLFRDLNKNPELYANRLSFIRVFTVGSREDKWLDKMLSASPLGCFSELYSDSDLMSSIIPYPQIIERVYSFVKPSGAPIPNAVYKCDKAMFDSVTGKIISKEQRSRDMAAGIIQYGADIQGQLASFFEQVSNSSRVLAQNDNLQSEVTAITSDFETLKIELASLRTVNEQCQNRLRAHQSLLKSYYDNMEKLSSLEAGGSTSFFHVKDKAYSEISKFHSVISAEADDMIKRASSIRKSISVLLARSSKISPILTRLVPTLNSYKKGLLVAKGNVENLAAKIEDLYNQYRSEIGSTGTQQDPRVQTIVSAIGGQRDGVKNQLENIVPRIEGALSVSSTLPNFDAIGKDFEKEQDQSAAAYNALVETVKVVVKSIEALYERTKELEKRRVVLVSKTAAEVEEEQKYLDYTADSSFAAKVAAETSQKLYAEEAARERMNQRLLKEKEESDRKASEKADSEFSMLIEETSRVIDKKTYVEMSKAIDFEDEGISNVGPDVTQEYSRESDLKQLKDLANLVKAEILATSARLEQAIAASKFGNLVAIEQEPLLWARLNQLQGQFQGLSSIISNFANYSVYQLQVLGQQFVQVRMTTQPMP